MSECRAGDGWQRLPNEGRTAGEEALARAMRSLVVKVMANPEPESLDLSAAEFLALQAIVRRYGCDHVYRFRC